MARAKSMASKVGVSRRVADHLSTLGIVFFTMVSAEFTPSRVVIPLSLGKMPIIALAKSDMMMASGWARKCLRQTLHAR